MTATDAACPVGESPAAPMFILFVGSLALDGDAYRTALGAHRTVFRANVRASLLQRAGLRRSVSQVLRGAAYDEPCEIKLEMPCVEYPQMRCRFWAVFS